MPGQATVTINEDQWNVWVASTSTELTTGLSGLESIPEGTGMLFVLPAKQPVTIDTSGMLFPIDIVFISENLVVDVASDIQPGYLVTEETPCDMFLEVNAGEASGVEAGDAVTTVLIQQPRFDLSQVISFAIPLAALGFVCTMAGGMAGLMGGSSSSPKQLSSPSNYKELPWYRGFKEVRDAVELGSPEDKKTLDLVADLMEESEPSSRRIELVRAIEARLHARGVETGLPLSEKEIQEVGYAEGLLEASALTLFMPRERLKELLGSSSSPKRGELPQVEKATVKCPICGDVIEIPEYDAVTRSEALRRHIEREHRGEKLLPQTNPGKFEAGEIVNFKGERVRVLEHVGDRVSIWVPSRQEEAWVKPESLEK